MYVLYVSRLKGLKTFQSKNLVTGPAKNTVDNKKWFEQKHKEMESSFVLF